MTPSNEVSNGLRYGLFVACLLTVARFGSVAWLGVWIFVFCQLCAAARVVWMRTRLPFMTAGSLLGAIDALLIGLLIGSGDRLTALFFSHPVPAALLVLGPAMLMFSEARFHPDTWRRLRQHGDRWTVRDMLLLRHIPDLRGQPPAQAST